MRVLYFLADAFINTFGITQPDETTRRQAAIFIFILILLAFAAAIAAFFLIHFVMQ